MFANVTDEQAQEIIRTIRIFVEIALDYYKKQKQNQDKSTDF